MIGDVYLMEFRTGWRGILLFMIIVMVVTWGMPQLFPSFIKTQEDALEGQSLVNLSLREEGGEAEISWEGIPNATGYMVLEDNRSYMLSPRIVYSGPKTNVTFQPDEEEGRYYAVIALVKGSTEPVLVGITSLEDETSDPFSQLFDNPIYRGFSGGREIQFFTLRGFLSVELFSWWIFLAGLYLAYMAVSTMAGDFEDRRMDIILSTPLSRRRYLIEKFSAQLTIALLAILLAGALTYASARSIDVDDKLEFSTVFLAWFGSLPLLLVIQAIAFLTVVQFTHSKMGIGLTFLFIFIEFALFFAAQISRDLESLKYFTVIHYWDYSSVMYDGLFKAWDFLLLFLVVGALLMTSIWVFSKRDIPV